MKKKRIPAITAMVFLLAAPILTADLNAQGRPAPADMILVTGHISVINGAKGDWMICPGLGIRRSGSPMTGLDVRLENVRLKETVPGYYAARITSIVPVAGMKLQFTVDSPVLAPLSRTLLPRKPAITGTGVIGSLAMITQPAAGAILSAAALGESLTVSWKGGAAPFTIGLMKPSGSAVLSIFEQAGLPGTSYPLPAALMPPGITYSIIVMYNMKPFVLQASGKELPSLLDKSSSVTMGGSDIITTRIF